MNNSRLYLFTNNFPYGNSETFIENEIQFLSEAFNSICIIPLYEQAGIRSLPSNISTEQPLIPFNPKQKSKLLLYGIFCLSPIFFAIPIFFKEKAYQSKNKIWNFFTSLLILRSCYKSLTIKPNPSDILYFYWGDNSALLIPFIKKKYKNTCVVRFHRFDIFEYVRHDYIPFRKWLFKDIDIALPISDNGKQYLLNNYGTSAPKNIIVSRLGVFDHGNNPEQNIAKPFQIISCSNLIPIKRVELLAKAIANLKFPTVWTHIGDGPNRQIVESIIANYPEHIQANMVGRRTNSEVISTYQKHHFDLFINVSENEGIPVSIMEAISFGIPVIATNVGANKEIADNSIGFLIDKNISPDELTKKIQDFFELPNKQNIRQRAKEKWIVEYNAETNYKSLINILLKK